MAKIDLTSNDWVDLVFEGRNQAYGAYKLRKGTSKRNVLAIIIMLVAAALIASVIGINTIIENSKPKVAVTQVTELSKLNQPKKKAEVKQKQIKMEEPEKVVERVKSSVKFTAPVIKKDNEVKPEDELKTQDELMSTKTAIGALDVKGNDDKGGEVLKLKEAVAQPEPKPVEEERIFEVVEVSPSFPGGQDAMYKFLNDNINYPTIAQENGVQGRVVLQFVVGRNGEITDVKVMKSVDPSLDREAVRVVKSMPRWMPGKQNGQAVKARFTLPVQFRLG